MFRESTGTIIEHRHEEPLGTYSITYEWEGGPLIGITQGLLIALGYTHTRPGDKISLGPFRIRLLEFDSPLGLWLAIKSGGWEIFYIVLYRSTRWLSWLYYRFILTLAVWGLADYNEAVELSWRQIHLFQWIGGQWRRFKGFWRKLKESEEP